MAKSTFVGPVALSKAEKARTIFAEAVGETTMPKRSVILARMSTECGLSMKAASTYLQNCKKAAGFIA